MTVAVGNVNGGTLTAEFVASLAQTASAGLLDAFLYASSPYLPENRNVVAEQFLAHDLDFLLFIDSDIQWEPGDIERLVDGAPEDAVCSGLYFHPLGSDGNASPVAWLADGEPVEWGGGGVREVAYAGCGFMLIPRRILDDVARAYPRPFEIGYQPDGDFIGEDLLFCKRLAVLGYRLLVNCDVVVRHVKPVALAPRETLTADIVKIRGVGDSG